MSFFFFLLLLLVPLRLLLLLQEEPLEKKPVVHHKTVKAAPYVAHMSSSEFAHHREAEVKEAVLHARRSQQKTG